MRYGFCTGFATEPLFAIDETMEAEIAAWGYDFIEYPLMSIAALDETAFTALTERVRAAGLGCDCVCNLFPASVRVIGAGADEKVIRAYLDTAFERAKHLGVKKIIFGSAGARKRGETEKPEADRQFTACLKIIDEYCAGYGMTVLIEAIRRGEADYINTLQEGAEAVLRAEEAGCRNIALMADLFHMQSNGEDPADLEKYISRIRHIHVCEQMRQLPAEEFSEYMERAMEVLIKHRYDMTVSYESVRPKNRSEGEEACILLKKSLISPPQAGIRSTH